MEIINIYIYTMGAFLVSWFLILETSQVQPIGFLLLDVSYYIRHVPKCDDSAMVIAQVACQAS